MRRHPAAPVNVASISLATSRTDFTAPEADFTAIVWGCWPQSWEIRFVTWQLQKRLVRSWRAIDHTGNPWPQALVARLQRSCSTSYL